MKTEFKARFLQHLSQKRQDKGFTLIELLVVIIIIGILSAIALPSFLNQANKAKESEAKQYTGSMNRAQQAKFGEVGGFATTVDGLSIGIKTQTSNFTYGISGTATDANEMGHQGVPFTKALRAYTGTVGLTQNATTSETSTVAVLCVTKVTQTTALAAVTVTANNLQCDATTSDPVTK
jgi:prepilin-type N-terminal cleavage/methylation domain-containing protein